MEGYGSTGLEGILQKSYTVKISEYIDSGWKTFQEKSCWVCWLYTCVFPD
jgi:hypothetical protein